MCRTSPNESQMCTAASVMILETWDLSTLDCIVHVAHRNASTNYDKSSISISRSIVKFMAHSSNLLLESDWPMPACSDSLGIFFGSSKTDTLHSLFAAAWDTRTQAPLTRPFLTIPFEIWIQGDHFQCSPPQLSMNLQCTQT